MRIRVTTRADLFEVRKRQHIERGYRVEEECFGSRERFPLIYRGERHVSISSGDNAD